jgi:hypothetical protein
VLAGDAAVSLKPLFCQPSRKLFDLVHPPQIARPSTRL